MKSTKSLHPLARISSFRFAVSGIVQFVRQEANARVHLLATLVVVLAGVLRRVDRTAWLALVLAITIVWLAEAFNTAVELLCDLWCEGQYHPKIKVIKDISAGAVLIASLGSVVTGVLVFFF